MMAMGPEQSNLVQQRQHKIAAHQEMLNASRGEGTSKSKGKTIDPQEWGNANIS